MLKCEIRGLFASTISSVSGGNLFVRGCIYRRYRETTGSQNFSRKKQPGERARYDTIFDETEARDR